MGLLFTIFIPVQLQAQLQSFEFSGNNPDSYQCFDNAGTTYLNGENSSGGNTVEIYKDSISGYYLCRGFDFDEDGKDDRAILRPPALQQIEIWFVRILYIIWAAVAGLSFFLLVGVGYQYILRGGTSDQELVKLRKRIINYAVGFSLVFLAVPILNTVFRLLGVNTDVDCYNVNMPGFQFFFTNVCTGNETLLRNACESNATISDGLACSPAGTQVLCQDLAPNSSGASSGVYFVCNPGESFNGRSTWVQFYSPVTP